MIKVSSEEDMRAFGERFGRIVRGGEVIELIGDVGAGKTTLVRGIALGMGVNETVQSPSFTISRLYDAKNGLQLVHYDFYRLNDPGIMADELAETLNQTTNVTIIEWSDAVKNILPRDRLTVTIDPLSHSSRNLSLRSGGPVSKDIQEHMK